ncbi:MAG: class I SAM-dependent methyltransferase, partial [Acidimicrobiales bacterium]
QYFEPSPRVASRPRTVQLALPDVTLSLETDRGVFSAGGIDPGTKFLLLDAPAPPADARHLLDLGCGYGPIALTLARRAPGARVWGVDVNERAVGLCARNAEAAGLDNVTAVTAAEGVPRDIRFDAIYSNPPIRVGKGVLHELLLEWLPRLGPDGHAYLVVQKHLGSDSLARWLGEQGWPTTRLGSRAGYRLLDVRRPDDAATSPPDDATGAG